MVAKGCSDMQMFGGDRLGNPRQGLQGCAQRGSGAPAPGPWGQSEVPAWGTGFELCFFWPKAVAELPEHGTGTMCSLEKVMSFQT